MALGPPLRILAPMTTRTALPPARKNPFGPLLKQRRERRRLSFICFFPADRDSETLLRALGDSA